MLIASYLLVGWLMAVDCWLLMIVVVVVVDCCSSSGCSSGGSGSRYRYFYTDDYIDIRIAQFH